MVLSLFSKLRNFFRDLPRPGMSYGILKSCRRCVYGKSSEPILIFSMHRGPRVIVNFDGKCYVRTGECIGFSKCGKCFEVVEGKAYLNCKWKEF